MITNKNNMREWKVTYVSFHRVRNCTSLVHGGKDDLSLGLEWVVNCSNSCHVSVLLTNAVVISCMQHVQLSNVINF